MTEPTRKRGRPKGPGSINKSHLPEMARRIKYDSDMGPYKAARKVLGPSAEKKRIDSLARCWKNYRNSYLSAQDSDIGSVDHLSTNSYNDILKIESMYIRRTNVHSRARQLATGELNGRVDRLAAGETVRGTIFEIIYGKIERTSCELTRADFLCGNNLKRSPLSSSRVVDRAIRGLDEAYSRILS